MGSNRFYYTYDKWRTQEDTKLTDIYDHDTVMHTFSIICILLILMQYLEVRLQKKLIKNVLGQWVGFTL